MSLPFEKLNGVISVVAGYTLSTVIHAYPTLSQIIKRPADQYYLDLLSSSLVKKAAKFLIGFIR